MAAVATSSALEPIAVSSGDRTFLFRPTNSPESLYSARMSFEEYLALEWEDSYGEWVDGEVFLYMGPTYTHQRILSLLCTHFNNSLGLRGIATVLTGPYTMQYANGRPGREPDIMVIATANMSTPHDDYFHGAPDLIIEIVSTDSIYRDQVTKSREFAAQGTPEYWLIDSREGHHRAEFYVLRDGAYAAQPIAPDGTYTSRAFPELTVKPDWFFQDPPPLAEAMEYALGRAQS